MILLVVLVWCACTACSNYVSGTVMIIVEWLSFLCVCVCARTLAMRHTPAVTKTNIRLSVCGGGLCVRERERKKKLCVFVEVVFLLFCFFFFF